jgi:hypothetical protein
MGRKAGTSHTFARAQSAAVTCGFSHDHRPHSQRRIEIDERAVNRTSFYAVSEAFLSQCLGGRCEAVGDDFKGSSIQVPQGAEFVPGLKAALATTSK